MYIYIYIFKKQAKNKKKSVDFFFGICLIAELLPKFHSVPIQNCSNRRRCNCSHTTGINELRHLRHRRWILRRAHSIQTSVSRKSYDFLLTNKSINCIFPLCYDLNFERLIIRFRFVSNLTGTSMMELFLLITTLSVRNRCYFFNFNFSIMCFILILFLYCDSDDPLSTFSIFQFQKRCENRITLYHFSPVITFYSSFWLSFS